MNRKALYAKFTIIGNDLTSSPEAREYYNRKPASTVAAAPIPSRQSPIAINLDEVAALLAEADARVAYFNS